MSDETITIESLQDLFDRWKKAQVDFVQASNECGTLGLTHINLKAAMKYEVTLDRAAKLKNELEAATSTFFKLNPGVDIDVLFAEKGL